MYKILLRFKDYENMIVPKKYGKIVLPLGKVNKTWVITCYSGGIGSCCKIMKQDLLKDGK